MERDNTQGYIPVVPVSGEDKQEYLDRRQGALSHAFGKKMFPLGSNKPLTLSNYFGKIQDSSKRVTLNDEVSTIPCEPYCFLSSEVKQRFSAEKEYASIGQEAQFATIRISTETFIYDHDNPIVVPTTKPHTGSGSYIQHKNLQGEVEDLIITNAHVVSDAAMITVFSHAHRSNYLAVVEHVCPEADIAILRVLPDPKKPDFFAKLKPFKLCDDPHAQMSASNFVKLSTHGYSLGNDYTCTEGNITNVEVSNYINSLQELPIFRTDAAISGGNSGGPATVNLEHNGKVIPQIVGAVFQAAVEGQNVNSVIPLQLITKVIEDRLKPLEMRGVPHLSFSYSTIRNEALRQYYQVQDNHGIVVNRVPPLSSFHGYIKEGDILLKINGYDITEKGLINYDWRTNLSFIFEYAYQSLGDEVEFKIKRHGQEMTVPILLNQRFLEDSKVGRIPQNKFPTFFIASGIVFTIYQMSDPSEADNATMIVDHQTMIRSLKTNPTDEIVSISNILAHPCTESYNTFEGYTVVSVNEKKIHNIVELVNAVDEIEEGQDMVFRLNNSMGILSTMVIPKMPYDELERLLEKNQISSDRCRHLREDRIDSYFEYQKSDGICDPQKYSAIFAEKGPYAAMIDNQKRFSTIVGGAQDAEDEATALDDDTDRGLAEKAHDAMNFLKDVVQEPNDIAFLLSQAIKNGKSIGPDEDYHNILKHLSAVAMEDKTLRERIIVGGLTHNSQKRAALMGLQEKIKEGLLQLSADVDPEYPDEPCVRVLMAFMLSPLLISEEELNERLEALSGEEDELDSDDGRSIDLEEKSEEESEEDDDDEASLADFIVPDTKNNQKRLEEARKISQPQRKRQHGDDNEVGIPVTRSRASHSDSILSLATGPLLLSQPADKQEKKRLKRSKP